MLNLGGEAALVQHRPDEAADSPSAMVRPGVFVESATPGISGKKPRR